MKSDEYLFGLNANFDMHFVTKIKKENANEK
jgi:hypothetical protein